VTSLRMEFPNFRLVRMSDIRIICYFLKREYHINLLPYAAYVRTSYFQPPIGIHSYALRSVKAHQDDPDLVETQVYEPGSNYVMEQVRDFLYLFWRYDLTFDEAGVPVFTQREDAWRLILGFVVNYGESEFDDILNDCLELYHQKYKPHKVRSKKKKVEAQEI